MSAKDEFEKGKRFTVSESIEYVPGSVDSRAIVKRTTGSICMYSFDSGEGWIAKTSPFDTLIQVIDGSADVIIENDPITLGVGQAIIIPAHARNTIKANVRFKMISTIIKSGYDGVIV
jgi:quercetin dioxygenase-like cupin family protein